MAKNIELIALVYKSTEYANHIHDEIANTLKEMQEKTDWECTGRIILNDPTPEIIKWNTFNYPIYIDPKPEDYYLNRVYRCWNWGGQTSESDNICFINSDMMFSKDWLINLLEYHDGINIPCSRLVESGKMPSGQYGISKDFGRSPNNLKRKEWDEYAPTIYKKIAPYGGLFMPCVFETKRFLEAGCYPEGNIYRDGAGTLNGPVLQSGDDWFFRKLEKEYGMKHVTVFNSISYHIQEGEKDV